MEERGVRKQGEKRYCVTGSTGYIASWLVNSLLRSNCYVHATVRDPASTWLPQKQPDFSFGASKYLHLSKLWGSHDRLSIFQADLLEEGSFDEAVKGCIGVFHVAAPMQFSVLETENTDSYVQSKIIEPAVKGTLNVLKACVKSKSVKKVVFTSSISTLTAKGTDGNWKVVVDESCQTPIDHVWNTKARGWVYALLKLSTENAAFQFAYDKGIDLVSVITTTVAGPFLTSNIPSSIQVLLSPLTGDPDFFPILSAVNSRMGSIAVVHIEDVCNAHIFLMEHSKSEGRYICCTQSCELSDLVHRLAKVYPCPNIQRLMTDDQQPAPCEISSKKLKDLGFSYKFDMQDIMHQTVDLCVDHGFLQPICKLERTFRTFSK
ncbi:putative anthocyanidin reductase isoform X2 [Daucus carota subsp. sativus]|uniref:putative anthocyanidin reductase isoform X2 n=1 Tax=Daucus carota subsp. sativus TaxID=79200 RepID=UPI0007EF4780|nr:PREDICTED: dihydroflavonol-4-reductase isoform X1 [Daucus carota subsp. sativus]